MVPLNCASGSYDCLVRMNSTKEREEFDARVSREIG